MEFFMNKIGVLIGLRADTDITLEMQKAKDLGCECCQLTVWDMSLYTDEKAAEVVRAAKENDIEITGSFRCVYLEGPPSRGDRSGDYITQVTVPIKT